MKRFPVTVLLTFFWGAIQLHGQGFKAHVALGVNISDDYLTELGSSQVGTRMGLNIGPGVSGMLNKRLDLSMEMLYSQNGFYSKLDEIPIIALDKIMLHYLEVPISLVYRLDTKKKDEAKLYKTSIGGGITYARLFKHKIIAINGSNLTNETRFDQENALLLNVVATSFFSESFALNGRGTLSKFGEWTVAIRLLYRIANK